MVKYGFVLCIFRCQIACYLHQAASVTSVIMDVDLTFEVGTNTNILNWFYSINMWKSTCVVGLIHLYSWWRHRMESFSALLALCEGNPPVDSPGWANKRDAGDFRRPRAHYDVTVRLFTLLKKITKITQGSVPRTCCSSTHVDFNSHFPSVKLVIADNETGLPLAEPITHLNKYWTSIIDETPHY